MGIPSSPYRSSTGTRTKQAPQSRARLSAPLRSASNGLLHWLFQRLSRTRPLLARTAATESQRNLVMTGLILGFFSIFASIFPPCGFLIALTGLVIGLYGRRTTSLDLMSSWAIALSFFGLLLTIIYSVFTISIYVRYLFS